MEDKLFVNPYNFIPLGSGKAIASKEARNLNGVIEYSVLTKTPLFIPNTSTDHAFTFEKSKLSEKELEAIAEHKSYDFFSYTNLEHDLSDETGYNKEYHRPVIPGSEIRGMFRSNFEILTNSCLSVVDEDHVLSKRTYECFQPGLIRKNEDGTYDLFEAMLVLWRTKGEDSMVDDFKGDWKKDEKLWKRSCYKQRALQEGQKVWFRIKKRKKRGEKPLASQVSLQYRKDAEVGYILMGEPGPDSDRRERKHCCHIFMENGKRIIAKGIDPQQVDQILKEYAKNNEKSYKGYKDNWKKFLSGSPGNYYPVYYSILEQNAQRHIMLSPACITREMYENRLKDLLRTFQSCDDPEKLCPACTLFGMMKNGKAAASRLRFTDLEVEDRQSNQDYYEECVTLPPLSSPKLNNMEFYVKRPDHAWFWTYDYYVDSKGETHLYLPEIAGRKFYWHQTNVHFLQGIEKSRLNMTIRPLKEGVIFTGKIYFQKISEKELNQLIWLVQAGEAGDLRKKNYGYKLGAAKPLGLGSIATHVDRVTIRKTVFGAGIVERKNEDWNIKNEDSLFDDMVLHNYMKMTQFDAVEGKRVCYPITKEQASMNSAVEEGYQWFTENHKGYKNVPDGITKLTNMPGSRNRMLYLEYMEAMEPELKKTCHIADKGKIPY